MSDGMAVITAIVVIYFVGLLLGFTMGWNAAREQRDDG